MIQTACAWVLLILAASPVTAPFSTCDLQSFMAHGAAAPVCAPAPSGAMTVATPISTDADGVSPLVTRSSLPKDSASSVAVLRQVATGDTAGGVRRPHDLNRPLRELSSQQTVLRL